MRADCEKDVSQEWILVLSWNFQRTLKGEDQLTKRWYTHVTTCSTITVTITNTATATKLLQPILQFQQLVGLRVLR